MGLQDFRAGMKNMFSFENIALLLTFGLVIVQLLIHIATKWFGYTGAGSGVYVGPYMLLLVGVVGVLLAFAIFRKGFSGILESKAGIAVIIVVGVAITFLLIQFPTLTAGTLFEPAAHAARATLGIQVP
jgi:hypothetical protein